MLKSLRIKAGIRTAFWLLIMLAFVLPRAVSQPVVSIGGQAGCPGSEALVPVEVGGFADVAAITLFIRFDTTAVSFVALENVNQALSGGTLLSGVIRNANPSSISISWVGTTPVNIGAGSLFSIRFYLKENNTALHFTGDCEIALLDLSVVENMAYNDGQISVISALSPDPPDNRVDEGSAAHFVLPLLNGASYQWQEYAGNAWTDLVEGDSFTGVKTQALQINAVTLAFNNRRYRCMLQISDCIEATHDATLQVRAVGIGEQGSEKKSLLVVYPNPVNDVVTYNIGVPIENARLRLLDDRGSVVLLTEPLAILCGVPQTLDVGRLTAGIYILQLLSNTRPVESVKIIRKL